MKRKKSIIAAIAIAIMCLMPLFSMAQILKLDGVATERQTGDGTGGWGAAPGVDPGTGEYAPLGSGLWVLAASAGLYLLVKSKKKRCTKTVMLAALALTLGTTQCHKPTQTETVNGNGNEPEERTIHISLTTGNIFNPKTDMNLYDGKITWNGDDKVYVVCGGKLLSKDALVVQPSSNPVFGTIKGSITVSQFGDITDPVFTFYYVGNGVNFTPAKNATSLTFDIANQKKAGCDVGEYMIGRTAPIQMEKTDNNTYVAKETVTFKPITSVLWLNTSSFGTGDMQLVGANAFNAMTIDLDSPDDLNGTHSDNISFTSSESVAVSVMPAPAANAPDGVREKIVLAFNGNDKWGSLDMNFGIKPGIEYAHIDGSLRSPLEIQLKDRKVVNLLGPATTDYWDLSNLISNGLAQTDGGFPAFNVKLDNPEQMEGYYLTKQGIHLIKGHKYYVRWETKAEMEDNVYAQLISSQFVWDYTLMNQQCYWPMDEATHIPNGTDDGNSMAYCGSSSNWNCLILGNRVWQTNSGFMDRTGVATGDYILRFDVNNTITSNYKVSYTHYMGCPMLIDLTETYENYGEEIPSLNDLRSKAYFEGEKPFGEW